ncbi:hypothetical protein IQ268_08670 [Oculatella sp. LEGE 06141]|uniref:hypothetical protein n=1 Tax=Oculatella sp. LEGE 06141 TaxID=1828648 RepID=UPI00187E7C7A|nr:hypothetical protein [Oculatella sp. LEGE 06141]MBE9178631.1 hypothetical protein [Oculatella sp. LEGE 06141]
MTWQGSNISVAGFNKIFQPFGVSEASKNEKLGLYECSSDGKLLQARTLVQLASDTVSHLISNG